MRGLPFFLPFFTSWLLHVSSVTVLGEVKVRSNEYLLWEPRAECIDSTDEIPLVSEVELITSALASSSQPGLPLPPLE